MAVEQKADIGAAYSRLLDVLRLEDGHRNDLRRRGFPEDEIETRGYRTLRNHAKGRAAKSVHDRLGDTVLNAPGFVMGPHGVTLAGDMAGILIPVRDIDGSVHALKIRRATKPKYVYLSDEDNSPGNPIHVPLGTKTPADIVRVTEGELKADVATILSDVPTIGVPGVSSWQTAIPVLKALEAKTVIIAFDAPDLREKQGVFRQAVMFWKELKTLGYVVELEDWV